LAFARYRAFQLPGCPLGFGRPQQGRGQIVQRRPGQLMERQRPHQIDGQEAQPRRQEPVDHPFAQAGRQPGRDAVADHLLHYAVGHPDPATFDAAYRQLAEFHDETWERLGLTPEQTVLGGFSMGSVMSYALGLGPGRPAPAGILAFSGFVPEVEGWRADLPRPSRVFIAHGLADPIIEAGFAHRARRLLEEHGTDVSYHEGDYGHWIEPAHAAAAGDWLAETLLR